MKICLIGEYSVKQWCGSAVHKTGRHILKELSADNNVIMYELPSPASRMQKLFSALRYRTAAEGIILTGGILNFSILLLIGRFDVTHMTATRRYMLLLMPALLMSRGRNVITMHDTLAFRRTGLNCEYFIKRMLLAACSRVFVYCASDAGIISRYKNACSIRIIKNGVDAAVYHPSEQKSKGRIITFAGGLGNDTKGLQFLSLCLPELNKDAGLQICGENRHKLTHPLYLGELDEAAFIQQLLKSRIVVVPSEYESFSLTTLESLSCGIPVIVTTAAGIAAYLKDGFDCLKIRYGSRDDLISAVKLLMEDESMYNNIRNNGLQTAKQFTWSSAAAEYLKHYE